MEVMETACSRCKHLNVCKYKEEFLKAQEAVNNATILVEESDLSGKAQLGARYISDIDYIEPIKLRCKHADYIPYSKTRSDPGVAFGSAACGSSS